jgi:hypothetical protein
MAGFSQCASRSGQSLCELTLTAGPARSVGFVRSILPSEGVDGDACRPLKASKMRGKRVGYAKSTVSNFDSYCFVQKV